MSLSIRIAVGLALLFTLTPAAFAKELTLDDRVRYQRAIEDVYWQHRIWPKENPDPKPALAQVLPDAAIRAKVEMYLKESSALGRVWQRPIGRIELQAELDRIVRDTRDGGTLAEIFHALDDDPYVIAEVLARQTLADRLARDWYASDARFDSEQQPFDDWWKTQTDLSVAIEGTAGPYSAGAVPLTPCTPDSWRPTYLGAPDARSLSTAVWTGSEMIVWGGGGGEPGQAYDTGARYAPATDTWTPTSRAGAVPSPRLRHTAVWTGTEMIVWGGEPTFNAGVYLNTGGRYNPVSDSWTPTSTGSFVPSGRSRHTAVWTGTYMIVWGGNNGGNTGGRYLPSVDGWLPTGTGASVPTARVGHTAVWTGSEMIVWGGNTGSVTNTGGRYDPSNNTWQATPTGVGTPTAREDHTAVWTGTEMIVWGGFNSGQVTTNTGARLNPTSGVWTTTSTGAGLPSARAQHAAVWAGSRMVIWSGWNPAGFETTGGRYDPAANTWQATTTTNAPTGRPWPNAVWTGSEMIVWGGDVASNGGRYNPTSDSWVPTTLGAPVPSKRYGHVAVWTGAEMVVWGGASGTNNGGRYSPSTDSWTPTAMDATTPLLRAWTSAVWTGTRMVVWGGIRPGAFLTNTGGRYDPATNTWAATSVGANVPTARMSHTAVWTGTQMIVWGGYDFGTTVYNTGGRYDPVADAWTATSTTLAPSGRIGHTAVWTGSQMVVWGGRDFGAASSGTNTGGRYTPGTNTWTATSTTGAPLPRFDHVAAWDGGGLMIVWGGAGAGPSGGIYDTLANTWIPTSMGVGVPAARKRATAVWSGREMIVWGGAADDPNGTLLNSGARYSPPDDSWTATSLGPLVPSPRNDHTAVIAGDEMIVWGGRPLTATGGVYCALPCAVQTYYLDADGDGYGAAAFATNACALPPGYSASATDCNDANPAVHPGAQEHCDGVDANCDNVADASIPPELEIGQVVRLGPHLWRYPWSTYPGSRYDAFRGVYAGAIGSDPFNEYCLGSDTASTSWDDDGIPEGGALWWFLVRAVNSCGDGTLGFATNHTTPTTERISLVCP